LIRENHHGIERSLKGLMRLLILLKKRKIYTTERQNHMKSNYD